MKRYPTDQKHLAQQLRTDGYTYREIREQLHQTIPKGTLSSWFKHIALPAAYFERIKSLNGSNIWKAQAINKYNLEARLQNLRDKNKPLINTIDKNMGKLILAVLYWCEGSKYPTNRSVKFGNSDPGMIELFIALLRSCYVIDETKFRLTIQCRADQDQRVLANFWQKVTNIQESQHYKPRVDQRSVNKPTMKKNYKGVCVVEYFDTNLQCELQFTGELLGSPNAINMMKKEIK